MDGCQRKYSLANGQCLCPWLILSCHFQMEKENRVQAYAPLGTLSLNQWDSLTSKLDGYPAG